MGHVATRAKDPDPRLTAETSLSNLDLEDLDRHPVSDAGATQSVPIIDIGPLVRGDDGPVIRQVCAEIAAASSEWGFFQIVGHGISRAMFDAVWRQTQDFFALPASVKCAILRTRDNPWGYYNNELTKNQRDRKEVFDFTRDDSQDIYRARNRWPGTAGAFRSSMLAYLEACEKLSTRLLQAYCMGLDLPDDYLEPAFSVGHTGFVRLNYYPVHDPMAGSPQAHLPVADLGVHHHTDAGALTLLLQKDIGGLQVYHGGSWHDIPPLQDALVVNTGDMMQVWSNDFYRAAVHRVIAMQEQDRYSIPFFFNPGAGAVIRPLPSTVSEARPPRYHPIDWTEFRSRRTDGDFADYGPEIQISQYRV